MSVRSDDVIRSLRLSRDELPLLDSRPSLKWIIATTLAASLILAVIGARIGPELRMRPAPSNTAGAEPIGNLVDAATGPAAPYCISPAFTSSCDNN